MISKKGVKIATQEIFETTELVRPIQNELTEINQYKICSKKLLQKYKDDFCRNRERTKKNLKLKLKNKITKTLKN